MNAKRVSAAAGVVAAALVGRDSSGAGIAAALEAAGLLQSPESAAELVALRGQVAELAAEREKLIRWHREDDQAMARLRAQRDRRRVRLVALQNDALNMRGSLAPNGEARKVPFELGETLAPAVDWLINRVAELEAAVVRRSRPVTACGACGDLPEQWCPDCAACRKGCFGGHDNNPCTHPNARWAAPAPVEDPHDSPLHHTYAVGRDLPEDPCHPCGCPKRFNRHADGCAFSECPSCGAPADVTGQRIPEHRTGCPQAVTA
ncbi:hypothetical protein [Streptomyces cyaneofuscatus]|uniref:hypothetical protein n=1 Tax=Streptomyces cyaneofuscatus TaxID=66883 RepID=UPI0013DAEE74|nr:hypothetical protein [Streptomyces cyaneofuscatus]NDZ63615.1 hypothetical protein [Streptomyces cyaneofuscatus]